MSIAAFGAQVKPLPELEQATRVLRAAQTYLVIAINALNRLIRSISI
jgi:hypothetical protein